MQRHLALAVKRLIARRAGALAERDHVGQRHRAELGDGTRHQRQRRPRSCGTRSAPRSAHVVLLAAPRVGRDLDAADQQLQRRGDVGRRDAEVGGAVAVDRRPQLGLADHERRVDVDGAGHLVHLREHLLAVALELRRGRGR